jgi:hypothetical protein
VTLSLQHLERDGHIERRDGAIYLLGEPPSARENGHRAAALVA